MRTRTYLTSGQYADALADGDAPNVMDGDLVDTIDEDGVTDAVVLPDMVREAVVLTLAVKDGVTLIERERVTVTVYEVDIVREAVAPIVSEPVDVAVDVAVSELVAVIVVVMLYEGDGAHQTGIGGYTSCTRDVLKLA